MKRPPFGSGRNQRMITAVLTQAQAESMTIGQISAATGLPEKKIYPTLRNIGWGFHPSRRGPRPGTSRRESVLLRIGKKKCEELTTQEVADLLGCTSRTASRAVGILGWSTRRQQPKSMFEWESVDWDMQDVAIAAELGCSRQRVCQKRRSLGMAPSLNHKRQLSYLKNREEKRPMISKAIKENPLITDTEMSSMLGIGQNIVSDIRKDLGYGQVVRLSPDNLIDWRLTNNDIAKLWNYAGCPVAIEMRHRLRKGEPMYKYPMDGKKYKNRMSDPEYAKIYEEQEAVAAEWRKSCGNRKDKWVRQVTTEGFEPPS